MGDIHHVNLNNVTKKYKSRNSELLLFESFSLTIPKGQRVAVVGPNGSGKSTLLKIILGVINPENGEISFSNSFDFAETSYIPQDYRNALFPWLKLHKNIRLYLNDKATDSKISENGTLHNLEKFSKISKKLQIDYDLEKYPYQLSGGEQQILMLIQSLLKIPKLFVADEPLSAVDFAKKELILEYLTDWLHKNSPTVILVSHDLEDAIFISDRIIVLSRNTGSIMADIPIEKPHPRSMGWRYTAEFREIVKNVISSIK